VRTKREAHAVDNVRAPRPVVHAAQFNH
jgi:hypothetical protein